MLQFNQFCRPEKCRMRCIDEIKYKVYEKRCTIVVKECPRCHCDCHHMAPICPHCGYRGRRPYEDTMRMGDMPAMGHMDYDD